MTKELLSRFCSLFYGYGVSNACWTYVGMEEGGGKGLLEARARLAAWQELDEDAPTVPLIRFLNRLFNLLAQPEIHPLASGVPLNKTWEFLIRIRLAAEQTDATRETMREVLAERFGDADGHSSLLELMPLPCPSVRAWPWPAWCEVHERKADFIGEWAPVREAMLEGIVSQTGNPRIVIFYGSSYLRHWLRIAGFEKMDDISRFEGMARWAERDGKLFIATWHPAGIRRRGQNPNVFAEQLGAWIRAHS